MSTLKTSDLPQKNKKFIGVHFKCCNVYCRIYINGSSTAYEGHCPCCRKKVYVAIGEGGTASRFFEAH